jgi:O-antigen/teichoic acid export membrane protein
MSEWDASEHVDKPTNAIRGGAAIAAASGGKQVLRLGSMVVLARLLTPDEFGIVAIMTAVFAMGAVFQEFGLSAATVQRAKASIQAISTLFWINAGVGACMSAVVFILAPFIADFFSRPELNLLCRVSSITFVLNGLAVQNRALLQRSMQFGTQARIDLMSATLGGACALLLAWIGWGYWALAGQILATDAATLLLLTRATRFVPIKPAMTAEVWEMLRFGSSLFGFNLLGCVAQNLHIALLGKGVGAAAAGIYTRGFVLSSISQGVIYTAASHVALPKLSKMKDADADFADFYYRGVQLLALVTAPIAVAFAVFGDQIALYVYGNQWGGVERLLRIFALGMIVSPILNSIGQIFVSRGETHRMLRWGVFGWCVMGACTVLGLPWGTEGVAWGWSLGNIFLLWPCVSYAFKGTPLSARGLTSAVAGPYLAAACMVPVGLLTRYLFKDVLVWMQLPAALGVCLLVYLVLGYVVFGQKSLIDSVVGSVMARAK